jgi:ubiquinone/menaquinone biosynthesis C-methylase UbiE
MKRYSLAEHMSFKSKLYDLTLAARYDAELAESTDASRRQCVPLLALPGGGSVIDLGCGTGLNQPYLAEALGEGGQVFGIDASPKMLQQAKNRAEAGGYADRLELIEADARKLRELVANHQALAGVDGILATLFLSVVPDWEAVFDQAFGLLGAGGRCVLMDTYWRPPLTWSQRVLCWRYGADATRPGFSGLQSAAADFQMQNFPPESDAFYIAWGSKAG